MNRVLIISYYFPPFNGPGAQHPDFFHRYLPEQGLDTSTITSAVYYVPNEGSPPAPEVTNVYYLPRKNWARSLCRRLYKAEMQAQVRMGRWQPGFVWGALFASKVADQFIAEGGAEAMISVSPPVSSHWVALRLKKRNPRLFWVADFQDPFVGNPFDGRITERQRRFEREIFSHANVLSANTDTALAMWLERYPSQASKMTVTWGGYDSREDVRALPLASPTPVLSYTGILFGARLPVALLESVARLRQQGRLRPNGLLVEFVGHLEFGPATELAHKLAEEGWLRLRPTYVPRPEALRIASQAHYSLLLDIAPGNAALQVPAKLFDQVRIGRPILAFTAEDSPAGRILEQSGIAHVRLKPDEVPGRVDEGVLELLRLPPEPRPPSAWFQENFDARSLAASMARRIRAAQGSAGK